METVTDFIFLGSKITVEGDCTHEIKRCLALRRKAMTNLDSIFKSRDITLPTKIHIVKAMVFLVVMNGCESWAIKKAECQRTDAFQLWCWSLGQQRYQTSQSQRKSTPNIHWKDWFCSWSSNTLLPDAKGWLSGKDPNAGGEGDDRGWDGWMISPTQWTWVWANSGRRWRTGKPGMLQRVR